jgi:hypothetical protein
VETLLDVFQLRLDERSDDYRKLSLAVLREHVRAYRALRGRSKGEPVETPSLPATVSRAPAGGLLSAAYGGWKKAKNATGRTADEFERAVSLFIQLHGDLPLATITRAHVRQFVEALHLRFSRRFLDERRSLGDTASVCRVKPPLVDSVCRARCRRWL